MRILFILENFYPKIGGVETLFAGLGQRLVDKGHEVKVLTRKEKDMEAEEQWNGMQIIRIGSVGRSFFGIQSIPSATRLAGEADLIQTSLYSASIAGALSGLYSKTPVVVTAHEVWDELWNEMPFLNPLEKMFYRQAERKALGMDFHRYIAVSKYTEERLKERVARPQDVRLVYNGIEYPKYRQLQIEPAPGPFRFLFFGRLGVSKGIDILAKAMRIWHNKEPDEKASFELIIPRKPKRLYKWLMHYIKGNELDSVCEIRHELRRDELLERIKRSDCILIPSYSEGFCFAAAEAVALGRPLIHSGRGALPEVAGGKVIEMEELSAIALYDAMKSGVNGDFEYRKPPKFPLEDCVEGYMEVYKEIAG